MNAIKCKYPNCSNCKYTDCIMSEEDIRKMRETIRKRNYRNKLKVSLPNCDECEYCETVTTDRGDDTRRLCRCDMRLIENRLTTSPDWCHKR